MLLKRLAFVALLAIALGAPVPRPVALAQSQNPCAAALAAEPASAMRAPLARAPKYGRFGADTRDIRDLLHQHSAAASMGTARAAATGARPAADRDDNNIAILEDNNGDLIIRANPFDLANTGLRFEPAGSGYAVASTGAEFRASLGRALTLGDDDSVAQTMAAPFKFYGRRFTSLFVNSDGNLTFDEGDNASTERGLTPRVGRAAHCAVLRRPRSVRGRPRVLRQRRGRDHGHLVRRARLRPVGNDDGAGGAVLERRHRVPLRRRRSHATASSPCRPARHQRDQRSICTRPAAR